MRDNKIQMLGYFLVTMSSISFASLGIFSNEIIQLGLSTSGLLSLRFLGSAIVLLVLLGLQRKINFDVKEAAIGIILGMCGYALAAYLFLNSIISVGMAKATVLLYTYISFSWPIRWIIIRKKPHSIEVITSFIALLGCSLVCKATDFHSLKNFNIGIVTGLFAGVIYALYLVLNEKYLSKSSSMNSTAWISLGAGLACLVGASFSSSKNSQIDLLQISLPALGLIFLSTIIPIITLLQGMKYIGTTKAAVISTIEPCAAAVLGFIFLSQPLEKIQIIGMVVVVASIILMQTYVYILKPALKIKILMLSIFK
jgi:drug/metabolite transporter (DMT)-like permease